MTTQIELGKVVNFNEIAYDRTINAYKQLLPLINAVAPQYEKYGFGQFSQATWTDILQNRSRNIRAKYDGMVTKSIEDLKIVSPTIRENMLKQARHDMDDFAVMVDELFNRAVSIAGTSLNSELPIFLENISIINNRATIDDKLEQLIRKHATSSIETETQAAVYQMYLEMKPVFDKMADLLKETKSSCDIFSLTPSNDSLLYVDDDGHLQFCGALTYLIN